MKNLSKIALLGALLAASATAATAQTFNPHDQAPAYSQFQNAPQNEPNKTNVGENGGA